MSTKKYIAVWTDRAVLGAVPLCEPGTLRDARKAIAALIRAERWRGSRYAALWPDMPIHAMHAGDTVAVHIGKRGYHLWAHYSIRAVNA